MDNNWNASSTDSRTPQILAISSVKQAKDFLNNDYVFIYEINGPITPFGLGANDWQYQDAVSFDARTTYSIAAIASIRAHIVKMRDEIIRILKANVKTPGTGYNQVLVTDKKDFSNKETGLGRMVTDAVFTYWGT